MDHCREKPFIHRVEQVDSCPDNQSVRNYSHQSMFGVGSYKGYALPSGQPIDNQSTNSPRVEPRFKLLGITVPWYAWCAWCRLNETSSVSAGLASSRSVLKLLSSATVNVAQLLILLSQLCHNQ